MNRLVLPAAVLALGLAQPQSSVAATQTSEGDRLYKCVTEAIDSCDKDFSGRDPYSTAIRGWCYVIRSGICYAIDPEV